MSRFLHKNGIYPTSNYISLWVQPKNLIQKPLFQDRVLNRDLILLGIQNQRVFKSGSCSRVPIGAPPGCNVRRKSPEVHHPGGGACGPGHPGQQPVQGRSRGHCMHRYVYEVLCVYTDTYVCRGVCMYMDICMAYTSLGTCRFMRTDTYACIRTQYIYI